MERNPLIWGEELQILIGLQEEWAKKFINKNIKQQIVFGFREIRFCRLRILNYLNLKQRPDYQKNIYQPHGFEGIGFINIIQRD